MASDECRACGKPIPERRDTFDRDRCRRCTAAAQPGDVVWGPTNLHTGEQIEERDIQREWRWRGFALDELTTLHDALDVLASDDPTHPDLVPVHLLAAEIKAAIDAGWSD